VMRSSPAISATIAPSATCEAQKRRVTTFIEVLLNQELGEPFRRDAMKKPVVMAGIKREDMRPQRVL
jgi:sulfoacetaldehyde acetyltransferase